MSRLSKQLTMFVIMFLLLLVFKVDVQADAVWNTTGELSPYGYNWSYKFWTGSSWDYRHLKEGIPKTIDVTYDVTYRYEEAYKMNELVNEQRRLAGVPELEMKDELMDVAMKRAAQTALYWMHEIPDGTTIYSASIFIDGENLVAGAGGAIQANSILVNSPGHYRTMIAKNYKYAGYGCVNVDGTSYWVQVFSHGGYTCYEDGYDAKWHYANDYYVNGVQVVVPSPNDKPVEWEKMAVGQRKDYTASFTTKIKPSFISLKITEDFMDSSYGASVYDNLMEGDTKRIKINASHYSEDKDWTTLCPLSLDQLDVKVLTPEIVSFKDYVITALQGGNAKIQFSLKADSNISVILSLNVKGKKVKKGDTYTISDTAYKVTSTTKKTVEYKNTNSDSTSVIIPKTVRIKGNTYNVTVVANNAFKNNKRLKSVTIGSNVTKIGKNAFYGCKKLKKITVKSNKIKSVGKNAFKGIHKNATIKVPKSKLKKYKALFKGKGQSKKVKIKK